jgi:hypothetical protein
LNWFELNELRKNERRFWESIYIPTCCGASTMECCSI